LIDDAHDLAFSTGEIRGVGTRHRMLRSWSAKKPAVC
jgi:hypothetical protein